MGGTPRLLSTGGNHRSNRKREYANHDDDAEYRERDPARPARRGQTRFRQSLDIRASGLAHRVLGLGGWKRRGARNLQQIIADGMHIR